MPVRIKTSKVSRSAKVTPSGSSTRSKPSAKVITPKIGNYKNEGIKPIGVRPGRKPGGSGTSSSGQR